MRRTTAVLLTGLFLGAYPAYPWWETGHRTVARIGAAHLTPAARSRLARVLNVPDAPDALADALAAASTWADETKAETDTGTWHYINLTLQDHKSDIPARCPKDNCATARIHLFAEQLSQKEKNRQWSELDALRFVVHLVGDIHQPLHAISNADLGGNCELLDPPIGTATNLHALWDGEIVADLHLDDRALAGSLESEIQSFSEGRREKMSHGNAGEWAWESHTVAEHVIYNRLHIPTARVIFPHGCQEAPLEITSFKPVIDRVYINDMKPVVRNQLILGGLRLARLLNESL